MDDQTKLRVLLDLVESLGIDVRRGPTRGGTWGDQGASLVTLRGKEMLFLDAGVAAAAQVTAIAAALAGRDDIEQMYLPPEIRETIDQARGAN